MAEPVITRYGIFTETKYEIYPVSGKYKAVKYAIPEEVVKKSMGGQLEELSVALTCLIYGIIYHLGIPRLLNFISKKI
jgi:hypothetical protein